MRKVIFIALSLLSVVGYGQGIKISALPQAGSLTGSELTPVVQNGITKKTTVQSIANLGGGGGSQNLQSVTTVGNTTSNNVQLLDSGNLIIGAYGGVLLDNSTSLKEGTFDNGTGGSKGISLNCAVGYELNWQGGHLSSSYNNGTTFYPVIVDTALQVNGLGGSGSVIVTADNSGLLGKASLNNLAWSLTGNSGTNPADNFLGTTDHRELYVKADTINVGTKYNSTSFNGLNTFTKDSTIYFNGIGIINDSATGASAIGEFAILKATDGSLDAVQIEFECNNGEGVEATLKVTPDVLSFGSYAFMTGNNNLSLDRGAGLYEMGIINGSIWMAIDSANDQFIFNNGYLKIIDGTEGAGKVLTSDATGLASWQTLALTDTATLNFGSISPNGHETLTITVTGAALSDVVSLGIPNASIDAHASFVTWVSSANTVSVKCFNFDGSSFNPAAGLFTVKVFK